VSLRNNSLVQIGAINVTENDIDPFYSVSSSPLASLQFSKISSKRGWSEVGANLSPGLLNGTSVVITLFFDLLNKKAPTRFTNL